MQTIRLPLFSTIAHPALGCTQGSLMKNAVILLSGGLDSATTLAIAKKDGYACHALSFDYGQRHFRELESAKEVATSLGVVEHLVLTLDLGLIGGSALTANIPIPKGRTSEEIGSGIPVTYVPARNTIFLAHALGWAEVLGADDLFFGANVYDYSGYPDCRREYVDAFERMANLATKAGVEGKSHFKVHTPLIQMTKAEIVRQGNALGVDFGLTWSCYEATLEGSPCGCCDSCLLRKKGFADAGLKDPLLQVD